MPHATTRQGRLFYLRRAAARPGSVPVLFVHGAGGNALLWGAVLNGLRGLDTLAIDLPGHGRSPGPGSASISAYADATLALADALRLPELVLAGHSMGSAVALELALREPGRVCGLALLSATARMVVAPVLLQQLVEDPPAARRLIVEAGYGPEVGERLRRLGAEQLAGVAPEVLHSDFCACSAFDVRSRLGEVRCPALVLCGSEDRLTPSKYVRALAEGLPNARFQLLPGAGHMLPMEAPEAVAKALLPFLTSLAGDAAAMR